MLSMTRRTFLSSILATMSIVTLATLSGCSEGGQSVTGTWYGVDEAGRTSTLEINEDGTWLFTGQYTANGDWDETDDGTIVLSAPLVSLPFKVDDNGNYRVLSFAGEDPSATNAAGISKSTFYATKAARDAMMATD